MLPSRLPTSAPATASISRSRKAATTTNVADRSFAGAGSADDRQHRRLHQPAACGRRLFDAFHAYDHAGLDRRSHRGSYGIEITPSPSETVTLSSASARRRSISLAPQARRPARRRQRRRHDRNDRAARQSGHLDQAHGSFRLADRACSTRPPAPTSGTTTAQSTVVDSSGNVYVIGNATGNFGNELNQGTQDVYLIEIRFRRQSAVEQAARQRGHAAGYSLALNPNGGVVVAGSTTADLTHHRNRRRQHRQLCREIRRQRQSDLGHADPDIANNQAGTRQRRRVRECLCRRPGHRRRSARGRKAPAAAMPISPARYKRARSSPNSNSALRAAIRRVDGHDVRRRSRGCQRCRTATRFSPNMPMAIATSRRSGTMNLGSLQRRRVRQPRGLRQSALRLRHDRERRVDGGRPGQVANASTGGTNAFVFNVTDKARARRRTRAAMSAPPARLDHGRRLDGGTGRHGLSCRHDDGHFRGPVAQRGRTSTTPL